MRNYSWVGETESWVIFLKLDSEADKILVVLWEDHSCCSSGDELDAVKELWYKVTKVLLSGPGVVRNGEYCFILVIYV